MVPVLFCNYNQQGFDCSVDCGGDGGKALRM